MLKRLLVVAAAVVAGMLLALALAVGPATSALADDGHGVDYFANVECSGSSCDLYAETTVSSRGGGSSGGGQRASSGGGGDSGSATCRNNVGQTAPCYDPQLGSITSSGCYRKEVPLLPSAPSGGSMYATSCATSSGVYDALPLIWVPDASPLPSRAAASPPRPVLPPPVVLAVQAARRLALPAPDIHANPVPDKEIVSVPVWVWISQSSWGSRSATASVPGLSVRATATAASVTWRFGDGTTRVCRGPGTPWRPGYDPASPSPTCGHVYMASSSTQRGGAYTVTATLTWSVAWSGGGQSGVFPALTRTSSALFRVAEVQAINIAGAG
jgi:hypothetical protein